MIIKYLLFTYFNLKHINRSKSLLKMKIISFDVGIKNMAYCTFSIENGLLRVQDWNVLNLIQETIETPKCVYVTKNKEKTCCNKNAKYYKEDQYFCQTHVKMAMKEHSWILYESSFKQSALNKLTKEQLILLGQQHHFILGSPRTKKDCIQILLQQIEEKTIKPIVKKKKKSANDVDLIHVGQIMKEELNKLPYINEITHVIIENQISKIATRMKTVQGMLTQYFIMQNICPHIEYISSSNKLKDLVSKTLENSYKQHKKDSIQICQQFLDNNDSMLQWKNILNTSKKDDLADSFLQGIWYIKNKKLITYAENLKINCVTLT